ncbi:3'-5' exonuclease [Modestobacter roseus]|uniref:3'-5' exonuclease n=1 Tax=Modestobacter roseus TaxID=1181884 RepID=UPI00188611C0|nr:3'-5' exonuclease [Modestobacter roseus]
MSLYRPEVALAALTAGVRFVVLDVETTPSDDGDHIVAVGIVQVDGHGKALAEPIEWRCNPGVRIENTRVHRLTDADVADEDPFGARIDQLARVLTAAPRERVVLVAHHAPFDIGVLHLEHQRAERALPDVDVLDTLALTRHLKLGTGRYWLPDVLAHFGLTVTQHHNALADATDTARVLTRLLHTASRDGRTDLAVLLAAAQPDRTRATAYPARPGARNTRAGAGSPFTFIERPASHHGTHRKLPKNPTATDLDAWLSGLRECIELRCPLLGEKAAGLVPAGRGWVIEKLLDDVTQHLAAGRNVDANAALGALTVIAARHLRAADAAGFHDQWADVLGGTSRCIGEETPFGACHECRADRACPADSWPHAIAVALTGAQRNLNWKTARPWLGPVGRVAEHAATRPAVAAHAAWLVVTNLSESRPGDADDLVVLADQLGLVEPRLIHRRARAAADAGDLPTAVSLLDAGLAARDGSSDRAWGDVTAYRDALAARQAAADRARPARPHRRGHSAPPTRPVRRRFTTAP